MLPRQASAFAGKSGLARLGSWLDSRPTQAKYYTIESFVFLFLVNLPLYLYLTGIWGVRPQLFFLAALLFVPFARIPRRSTFALLPFAGWNMLFLLTVAASALLNPHSTGPVPCTSRFRGG